jgi:hypothetical protein
MQLQVVPNAVQAFEEEDQ